MNTLNIYSIDANGTPMGVFKAADADAAVLAYVIGSGYASLEQASSVLDITPEEFIANLYIEDLSDTYEYLLADIRSFANEAGNERSLNVRREELVKLAQQLQDGGLKVDWSGDLDDVLAGSLYKDSLVDECAVIVSREAA